MKIRHIGIYVDDLEKMKKFYSECFDMDVLTHEIETGNYIDTVLGLHNCTIELYKLISQEGCIIELLKYSGNEKGGDVKKHAIWESGVVHIAITVANVDCKYTELINQGIEFISEPYISSSGKAKVCFCKDPEGNYLELVEEL